MKGAAPRLPSHRLSAIGYRLFAQRPPIFLMKTRLLCCSLVFAAGLAYSEDQKPVSSVQTQGQGSAAGTEIVLNQIAMDQFPAVHVFVTVLKDGKPQSGLTAADFRVREDEVDQQPLTVESQLPPLSVVIAIDNSGSMRPRLPETRAAAKSFLDILAPADSVQVVGFAQQVKVLGPMSSNRGAAGKAIELTTARGNTALYDALFTSVDLLKDRPGRKAVVLLSDGVDDNGVGKQLSKHSVQNSPRIRVREIWARSLGPMGSLSTAMANR